MSLVMSGLDCHRAPLSLREKLAVARRLGLAAALLPGPEVAGCLEELLLPE